MNERIFIHRSYNKSQEDALFLNFTLVKNSTYFGQIYCPSSGVLIMCSQRGRNWISLADSQHK